MDQAVAYSTLALTVTLAVSRPRLGMLRFSPGTASLVGVFLLLAARITHLILCSATTPTHAKCGSATVEKKSEWLEIL